MHILWIIGGIIGGIAVFLLVSLLVQRLWNWLVPAKFNGPRIEFKHAMGILLLSKILLGGFGHRPWGGPHRFAYHDGRPGDKTECYEHRRFHHGEHPTQPAAPLTTPGSDSTQTQQ